MYYSSTLFAIVGFSNPIAVGTVVAVVNWIFTVLSIFIIDRVGRRRLLLWTMWAMVSLSYLVCRYEEQSCKSCLEFLSVPLDEKSRLTKPVFQQLCLILAAIAFKWVPIDQKTLKLTNDNAGWSAYVVLVAMILFVATYAAGLGCVPWQANEFLPMEVRAMGTMMSKRYSCLNLQDRTLTFCKSISLTGDPTLLLARHS